MPANVPHFRPEMSTTGLKSGNPVYGGPEWLVLANLGNWCNGHGAQLIPWCAVNETTTASKTFHFYVGPKKRAVERVWVVNARASTADVGAVTITAGGASAVSRHAALSREGRSTAIVVREALTAKTSTAGDTSITIEPAGGKEIVIESISMYEQTRNRLDLDTVDYGTNLPTVQSRQRIYDAANVSVSGVMDAYENLDARRAGFFHWSVDEGSGLARTDVAYTDIFPLTIPMTGAIVNTTETTTTVTVAAYAKVNAGSGNVKFLSDQAGDSVVLAVTGTSFAWVTDTLTIQTEDLSIADGRRGNVWEAVQIQAQKDTATTLTIAALSVIRTAAPI